MPELQRPTPIGPSGPRDSPSGLPAPQAARTPDEDDIDVDWYAQALGARWLLLLGGAAVCAVVAFGIATLQPVRFEGTTTLLIVPPASAPVSVANPATFRAIIENGSLASQVIKELNLDQPPHGLTPQRFLENALYVDAASGTNVVKVRVRLGSPDVAADASRRLARKAVALSLELMQQGGSSVQEQLKNHLKDAAGRMEASEKAVLEYEQQAQVELLKEDTEAMLAERRDLLRLTISIESEEARLATAEAEIKRQERILSVPRAVESEEALRRTNGTREILDSSNPFINPVFQSLDFQIAVSRAELAALKQQRRQLVEVRKIGDDELSGLSELYRREIDLARLQSTFDLAKKVYGDLAVRYEESRTQGPGNSPQLQLVDEGVAPDRPLSRRRAVWTVFGFGAGLLGFGLLALALESRSRRAHDSRPGPV